MTPLAFMDNLKQRFRIIIEIPELEVEHRTDAVGINKDIDDDEIKGSIGFVK